MIDAWLSSSEITASRSSSSTSNTPPLASKQDEYRIVASVPRNGDSRASSSVCWVCVPQMNRTLRHAEAPLVQRRLRRGDDGRVVGQAEVVVGAEVQHVRAAGLHVRRLRRGELPLVLVQPGVADLVQRRRAAASPHRAVHQTSRPIEDDLAALPAARGRERLGPVVGREAVRDRPAEMSQARAQHRAHRVPGLVHLAAVDALDRDHVGDDLAPSRSRSAALGRPSIAIRPPWLRLAMHVRQRGRVPAHLQRDVEALDHAEPVAARRRSTRATRPARGRRPSRGPARAGTARRR